MYLLGLLTNENLDEVNVVISPKAEKIVASAMVSLTRSVKCTGICLASVEKVKLYTGLALPERSSAKK